MLNNAEGKSQSKMLHVYNGLDKSLLGNNVKLNEYFKVKNDQNTQSKLNITYAGR
jgi:hypothetical protein